MDELSKLRDQQGKLSGLLGEIEDLGQPRTNYTLKHFVVGQHDLPARQRQQCLVELQSLLFSMADMADEMSLAELDIEEANENMRKKSATGIEMGRAGIKINQKKRFIESCRLQISGRLRECETLFALLEQIPQYTREQFEAEEAAYWSRRLSRQFVLAQRDMGGNLTAVLETLTEPGLPKPQVNGQGETVVGVLGVPDSELPIIGGGE